MGDVVIGVAFEVGLVFVVGVEVDLGALQHGERFPQAMRYLLAHQIQALGCEIELL